MGVHTKTQTQPVSCQIAVPSGSTRLTSGYKRNLAAPWAGLQIYLALPQIIPHIVGGGSANRRRSFPPGTKSPTFDRGGSATWTRIRSHQAYTFTVLSTGAYAYHENPPSERRYLVVKAWWFVPGRVGVAGLKGSHWLICRNPRAGALKVRGLPNTVPALPPWVTPSPAHLSSPSRDGWLSSNGSAAAAIEAHMSNCRLHDHAAPEVLACIVDDANPPGSGMGIGSRAGHRQRTASIPNQRASSPNRGGAVDTSLISPFISAA